MYAAILVYKEAIGEKKTTAKTIASDDFPSILEQRASNYINGMEAIENILCVIIVNHDNPKASIVNIGRPNRPARVSIEWANS